MFKKFSCTIISLIMILSIFVNPVLAENESELSTSEESSTLEESNSSVADSESSEESSETSENESSEDILSQDDSSTEEPISEESSIEDTNSSDESQDVDGKASLEILPCTEGFTSLSVGTHDYPSAQTVEIKLTPNVGYHVYGVEIDNVFQELESDTISIELELNKIIKVRPVFRGDLVFNVEQTEGGKVSPEGTVYIAAGKVFDVTATPDHGYKCTGIYINDVKVEMEKDGNSYKASFSARKEKEFSVYATFEAVETYTATLTKNEGGKVLPFNEEGKAFIINGESAQFQAIPDEGFGIKSIKINDEDTTWTLDGLFTVENVSSDFSVSIEFAPMESIPVTITKKGKGTVTDIKKAYKNTTLVLDITPDEGNEIVSVKINDVLTTDIKEGKLEIAINEDIFAAGSLNIEVVFDVLVEKFIIRTVIQNSIGGVITAEGYVIENMRTEVRKGGSITLTFTPHMNYVIEKVKVDGIEVQLTSDNTFTIQNVTQSHSVVVSFVPDSSVDDTVYKVDVKSSSGGTVTPESQQLVKSGDDVTFTFKPDSGYELDYILVNGTKKEVTENTYTIEKVIVDYTLEVFFKQIQGNISGDINWDDEKIKIDITASANVDPNLFNQIKEKANNKEVIFKGNDFFWTLPASYSYPSTNCDFSVLLGKNRVSASIISSLEQKMIENKIQGFEYEIIKTNCPKLTDDVKLSVHLGSNFIGKELDCLYYEPESGKFNSVIKEINSKYETPKYSSTKIIVDDQGNAEFPYIEKEYYVLVVSSDSKFTLNVISGEHGSTSPRGTMSVPINFNQTIQITPDPGYMVSEIIVNGASMYQECIGKTSSFTISLGKINSDYTVEVSFEVASDTENSNNSASDQTKKGGLKPWVVAIIIIGIAIAGGVALFIYKWNEEKDIVD